MLLDIIKRGLEKLRKILRNLTIPAILSFGIGSFYLYRVCSYTISRVDFDIFRKAVEAGIIEESMYLGSIIFFKGFKSNQWYSTRTSSVFPRHEILTMLSENPSTKVSDVPLSPGFFIQAGRSRQI